MSLGGQSGKRGALLGLEHRHAGFQKGRDTPCSDKFFDFTQIKIHEDLLLGKIYRPEPRRRAGHLVPSFMPRRHVHTSLDLGAASVHGLVEL